MVRGHKVDVSQSMKLNFIIMLKKMNLIVITMFFLMTMEMNERKRRT